MRRSFMTRSETKMCNAEARISHNAHCSVRRNIYCFPQYYEGILTCFTACLFSFSSHLHENNDKNSEILYAVDPLKWLDANAFSINMLMLFLILSDGNPFLWFGVYLRLVARISHPIVLQLSESCLLLNFFLLFVCRFSFTF